MTFDAAERSQEGGAPVELYRVAVGGTIYRWTSADRPITVTISPDGSQAYNPEPIERGAISYSGQDDSGSLRVTVSRFNVIGQMFIAFTPPSPVAISIYRKHSSDSEIILLFTGTVAHASCEGGSIALTCAPMTGTLKRNVPRLLYQGTCNWALYGPGCGVNPGTFQVSGTILSQVGRDIFATQFVTKPDGWFTYGWVQLSDGSRRYVTAHEGPKVTLQSPFIGNVTGAAFDAYAGCDKTESTCNDKFSNMDHHLGFKRLPARNPFVLGLESS